MSNTDRKEAYMARRAAHARADWMTPQQRESLPDIKGGFERGRDDVKPVNQDTPDRGRGSDMIRRERPHPAPRPSPGMAADSDRQAHQARMRRDDMNAVKTLHQDDQNLSRVQDDFIRVKDDVQALRRNPNQPGVTEAQRQFYVLKRRSEQMRSKALVHVQKFNARHKL